MRLTLATVLALLLAGTGPLDARADALSEILQGGDSWLEEHHLDLELDVAFFEQYASRTVADVYRNAGTFSWLFGGDWRFAEWQEIGNTHLCWTTLGTVGLDYDSDTDPLSERVGTISGLNNTVYPDGFALDEFYVKQVWGKGRFLLEVGLLDMTYFLDTNALANNGFTQFFSLAFEDNLSIPFPVYGGLGARGRVKFGRRFYVMAAASDAASNERDVPWESIGQGFWWELIEIGVKVDPEPLGKGVYRITPWHSDVDGSGFGVGINFEQELGSDHLLGFMRFGVGDPEQTDVRTTVSGGVSLEDPFGRAGDVFAAAISWADPSEAGRSETFFETYYNLVLTEHLALAPDLQIVVHPAQNTDDDVVLVGGVRLALTL